MIIYFFIFIISVGGISAIALRHKEEITEFRFALFMESTLGELSYWWYNEAHTYFFKVLEKLLRRSRIWVLKMESFLFRKVHAIRSISERNGNRHSNGGTGNKKAEQ